MSFIKKELEVQGLDFYYYERKNDDSNAETVVLLDGLHGVFPSSKAYEKLFQKYNVIVPVHPGFGYVEKGHIETVEDLSYFYLDFFDKLSLKDIHLVGVSLGGWAAAEIAVKNTSHLKTITFINTLGIKISDRTTVDITDIYTLNREKRIETMFYNREIGKKIIIDPKGLSEDELYNYYVNEQNSLAIGWKPFMHNPKLIDRLHRVNVPAIVLWGAEDGVVSAKYGKTFANSLPQAEFHLIEEAGHYAHLENPDRVNELVDELVSNN